MILSDPINCTIPSVDALKIKGYEITCTTSLIDSAKGTELFWVALGSVGAFGAMVLTLFMARYAWKAWDTAQKQLMHSQREAITLRRQGPLIDFLKALRTYYYDSEIGPELSNPSVDEVRFFADIWTITYPGLVKEEAVWKILELLEELLVIVRYGRNLADSVDADDFDYRLSVQAILTPAELSSKYIFETLNTETLKLHRVEISEYDLLNCLSDLENFAKKTLGEIDELRKL